MIRATTMDQERWMMEKTELMWEKWLREEKMMEEDEVTERTSSA